MEGSEVKVEKRGHDAELRLTVLSWQQPGEAYRRLGLVLSYSTAVLLANRGCLSLNKHWTKPSLLLCLYLNTGNVCPPVLHRNSLRRGIIFLNINTRLKRWDVEIIFMSQSTILPTVGNGIGSRSWYTVILEFLWAYSKCEVFRVFPINLFPIISLGAY